MPECNHVDAPIDDHGNCCRCKQRQRKEGEWNKAFGGHGPIGGYGRDLTVTAKPVQASDA
jgi:hypothetical protein